MINARKKDKIILIFFLPSTYASEVPTCMQTVWPLLIFSKSFLRKHPTTFLRHFSHFPPPILPTKAPVGLNKPILWLCDRYMQPTPVLDPTVEYLHELIRQNKFATAYRVRCALQDQGRDIPHDMLFLSAALGEINSLSSVTYNAFYAWLNLLPAKYTLNAPAGEQNPFRLFRTLYRSGVPSRDFEAILGMVKIACSKGYFFEEFRWVMPLMVRLVKPTNGFALALELEKSYVDYIASAQPVHVQEHTSRAREILILGCCDAKGRWRRIAIKLLKRSRQEGISVSPGVTNEVRLLMVTKKTTQAK